MYVHMEYRACSIMYMYTHPSLKLNQVQIFLVYTRSAFAKFYDVLVIGGGDLDASLPV